MDQIATNINKFIIAAIAVILVIGGFFGTFLTTSRGPEQNSETEQFNVGIDDDTSEIAKHLKDQGFIRNILTYKIAFLLRGGHFRAVDEIQPGAYRLSKSMSAWRIADTLLHGKPYMKWVVFPEGLRKEEIAEILATMFAWGETEKEKWISVYTTTKPEYTEGVYFPDTYLIPAEESPADVAKRMQTRFEEKFAPYAREALRQNIRWYTALKVASLVQREAAGKSDMPLIAGILWNRLLKGMKFEIDATLQYARGKTENGWWAPITSADKERDSPYNTYKHKGLPPHPIANPGLDAIKAVLFPEETKCLFYLHDGSRQIHCAEEYEEHRENIKKYLQ